MNLPAISRADRLLLSIVLVTAILGGLAAWLLKPPEKTGGFIELPSTFYNVGYGTKASYLMLDRLGFPVARLRQPLTAETLRGVGTLFILRPMLALENREMAELKAWVEEGHTLVVSPSDVCSSCKNDQESLGDWFRLNEAVRDKAKNKKPADTAKETDANETAESPAEAEFSTDPAELDADDPIVAGVHELIAGHDPRFQADRPCAGPLADLKPHVFWKDKQGVLGLWGELGEGRIIALADTDSLSNRGIGLADNSLLLGNLVRQACERSPGQVAFDEFHLGFAQKSWAPVAMAELLWAGNWRWAALQILFAALLALAAGAVRFGSPKDIIQKRRRQHREFAEAAGRLLDEAGATAMAADTLCRHYRGQLCRLVSLEPEVDDQRLAAAVRSRSGREIAGLLEDARRAAASPVSRQKLFAISKEFYQIVEAIAHGT